MQKRYRRFFQALLLATCLVVSMSAVLYAAEEEPATTEPGMVIVALDPDGPAAKAGVARGDILLAVDGVKVNTIADLVAALDKVAAGGVVTLQLQHGDATVEYEVTTDAQQPRAYLGIQPYGGMDFLAPAPDQLPMPSEPLVAPRPPFAFPPMAGAVMNQVVVVDVLAESGAAEAGLQVNDVITAVNGEAIPGLPMLRDQVATLSPGDVITLTVTRAAAEPTDIAVTLGEGAEGQAQIGVQLGMVSVFDAAQEHGQPPAFRSMPPMMRMPFEFGQEGPGQTERRFFHFGRPAAPSMYFFVLPYPGWPPFQDFLNGAEEGTMAIPAQPGQWFSAPPVSVEIRGEIQRALPTEQAPGGYY